MNPKIGGSAADFNDNNPVEVRRREILGSSLDDDIGRFPETPIRTDGDHHWQYFPTGMVVSSRNTCAAVLYGSIAQYYANVGAFRGALGAPMTDVLPLLDGTMYAAFENGVVWDDPDYGPTELNPMPPDMVRSFASVDVTAGGIAGFAQARVAELANAAVSSREDLRKWVDSITATVSFVRTGNGGCAGADFNAVGRSLNRSHVFHVRLDIELKGCAGAFGDASADMTIEVRAQVIPPNVSARLVGFSVDSVSSPFSAADSDMRSGLIRALNEQYSRDLMGRSLPDGFTVLAALVNTTGAVDIYLEPMCGAKETLGANDQLDHLRASRRVLDGMQGKKLSAAVDLLSPAVAYRLKASGADVSDALTKMVARSMERTQDPEELAERLRAPLEALSQLVDSFGSHGNRDIAQRLLDRAAEFVAEAARSELSLEVALERVLPLIREGHEIVDSLPELDRRDPAEPFGTD